MQYLFSRLAGKLLGKAIIKTTKNQEPYLYFRHMAHDYTWAMYCYTMLKEHLDIRPPENDNFGKYNTYIVTSKPCSIINMLFKTWYPNSTKEIPFEFLQKYFTAESLAWWYQDNGHLKKRDNKLEKIILSTNSFEVEENYQLIHFINEKFGLHFSHDGQNRLLLYDQLQINYFLMLVQPWMQPSMIRKNKSVIQFDKIAKRTTVYLPSNITLTKPTKEINSIIERSLSEKTTETILKELPLLIQRRSESPKTNSYQIQISPHLYYPLLKTQALTGLHISQIITLLFEKDEIQNPKRLENLDDLSSVQQNILIGSILGDGTLSKRSHHSRHKNSMYREHFSKEQLAYREWKVNKMKPYFYLNNKQTEILSRTQALYTKLEKDLYPNDRIKRISESALQNCTDPHFLAVLYMDDGTLQISKYFNHRQKRIYLTPAISIYLQAFPKEDLELLSQHLLKTFNLQLKISKRTDGYGYYIKTTKVKDALHFLETIESITKTCPSMAYKTDWNYRFSYEKGKLKKEYPEYEIFSSDSKRRKEYSKEDIKQLILLWKLGYTVNDIASEIGRSSHSVYYKLSWLRKRRKI